MKWSDGVPFTADDFLFWYNDIILNDELTPVKPKTWSPGGELVKVEKLNDWTVRFRFVTPYPSIIDILACGNDPFAPRHYFKKYHIKYNPKANEIAKKEGYDFWWQCFNFHNLGGRKQKGVNLPCLKPWTLSKGDSHGNLYYKRNPYYWKIDTAGNQLPYIDRQTNILVSNVEVMNLKVINGEFDNAAIHLHLKNFPLYKDGEKRGNYHVMLWPKSWGSDICFTFNETHKDPVLRKIFSDLKFRQAMSLAINRDEINEILFFGKATPRQATAPPDTSFYEDWMGKYYIEYDPKGANKLLDEMGLKWDKNHQYRLRPDGKTLAITIEYFEGVGGEPIGKCCELVKEYWG